MDKFEYTSDGYKLAKEYLESIDKFDYISTHGFSTDGWSIIHAANSIYKRITGVK